MVIPQEQAIVHGVRLLESNPGYSWPVRNTRTRLDSKRGEWKPKIE